MENAPQTEAKGICLYDLEIRSLGAASPQRLALRLMEIRVVPSADTAQSLLMRMPLMLAQNVPQDAAGEARALLEAAGGEIELRISKTSCLHCGTAILCREGSPHKDNGFLFRCWGCSGLILLEREDRRFRAALRCRGCHSVLALPVKARSGIYPCGCGTKLNYVRKEPAKAVRKLARRPRLALRQAIPFLLALSLVSGVIVQRLLPVPEPEDASSRATVAEPRVTSAYRQFSLETSRVVIAAALGQPERESRSFDSTEEVLFYRRYDLCVVLHKQTAGFRYTRTVRMSDDKVLHAAP